MAFIARIAYRHANGEVEGFVGVSLSSMAMADQDAVNKIRVKCCVMATVETAATCFDPFRIIRHSSLVAAAEMETLRRDWLTYYHKGSSLLPMPRKDKAARMSFDSVLA